MDTEDTDKKAQNQTCPHCHGVGFVRVNVPVGHPLFGKAIPCVCKRRELQEQRLARLRRDSNLQHLRAMTFDTFEIREDLSPEVRLSLQDALNTAREFAANPQGWLLFIGQYGCGKTHLAVAIANERIQHNKPALFVVVPDLLDYLRAAYAPESTITYDERFDQVRRVELLILDDLGTQNATPWATEKLYQILNYRYNAGLPTVITTNQNLEDMDPRLASRLQDQSLVRIIPIYAPDSRTQGNEAFGSLGPYGRFTFETFSLRKGEIEPLASEELAKITQQLREWAENPINWVVLRGPYGVGKTHLAAAIANKVSRAGMDVMFVVVSDLLDHLRATFQPNSPISYDQRFNTIRRVRMLVLDDLGAQNSTPWAQEKLFQILNYRYVSRLPTIITISDDAWEELDERLKSRLIDADVCCIIDIDVPPYRGTPREKPKRSTRRRL